MEKERGKRKGGEGDGEERESIEGLREFKEKDEGIKKKERTEIEEEEFIGVSKIKETEKDCQEKKEGKKGRRKKIVKIEKRKEIRKGRGKEGGGGRRGWTYYPLRSTFPLLCYLGVWFPTYLIEWLAIYQVTRLSGRCSFESVGPLVVRLLDYIFCGG